MITERQLMDLVHEIDKTQGEHRVRLENLESWVSDIHKTLKAVEFKVTMASGIFIAIEVIFKIWR